MAKPLGSDKIGGRVAGTPNRLTATVKDVFTNVFTELQDDSEVNLKSWGKKNPTDFYKLCAKLIPAAVDVTSGGDKVQSFDLKSTVETFLHGGDKQAETSTS